jgi:hypothetical protein
VVAPFAAALAGILGYAATQKNTEGEAEMAVEPTAQAEAAPAPIPRENAVLVFGATGRMGRLIVQEVRASISSLYSIQVKHSMNTQFVGIHNVGVT